MPKSRWSDADNPRKPSKIKACGDFYFVSGYDLGTENLFFVFRSQPHKSSSGRKRMAKSKENLVDEGFRVSLVETAFFDGKFEIPHINLHSAAFGWRHI